MLLPSRGSPLLRPACCSRCCALNSPSHPPRCRAPSAASSPSRGGIRGLSRLSHPGGVWEGFNKPLVQLSPLAELLRPCHHPRTQTGSPQTCWSNPRRGRGRKAPAQSALSGAACASPVEERRSTTITRTPIAITASPSPKLRPSGLVGRGGGGGFLLLAGRWLPAAALRSGRGHEWETAGCGVHPWGAAGDVSPWDAAPETAAWRLLLPWEGLGPVRGYSGWTSPVSGGRRALPGHTRLLQTGFAPSPGWDLPPETWPGLLLLQRCCKQLQKPPLPGLAARLCLLVSQRVVWDKV